MQASSTLLCRTATRFCKFNLKQTYNCIRKQSFSDRTALRSAPENAAISQRWRIKPQDTGADNTSVFKSKSGVEPLNARNRGYEIQLCQKDPNFLRNVLQRSEIALRDVCGCPLCVDQSTRQREFSFTDIPLDIAIKSVTWADNKWHIQWKNDIPGYSEHVSEYSPEEVVDVLRKYHPKGLQKVALWDKDLFEKETQQIEYKSLMESDLGLEKTLQLIERHGLVFIKEVPEDPEAVRHMANRLGFLRNTFYGETWNVQSVPQAKNVAYTSKFLGFHMDLLYMKEPPGLQLLHCLENTCTGGESLFADTFKAIDTLHFQDHNLTEVLRVSRIRYTYSNDGHFYTDVKPVLSKNKRQWPRVRLVGGAKTDVMGYAQRVYWSPPFIGSICETSNVPKLVEASKAFVNQIESPQSIYKTKMEAGTCAIFDNLRVVHARNAFDVNSGRRWLKGAYADIQDVWSNRFRFGDGSKEEGQKEET